MFALMAGGRNPVVDCPPCRTETWNERAASCPEAEKVGRPVGRHRRQYRALHGGAHRQRPALPRLRHPGCRRAMRVRGDRLPARARRLPNRAELAAYKAKLRALRGLPASVRQVLGGTSGRGAPDGRDADRGLGARLHACRKRTITTVPAPAISPTGSWLARRDAPLLVSLLARRPAHRGGDGRRLASAGISCTSCTARGRRKAGCAPCTRR